MLRIAHTQVIHIKHLKGLTLVEVLVALLVLSIGLLGIAGLQLTGLKENQNAHFRTQAVFLAQDMADRMRANPQGTTDGNYDNIDSTMAGSYTEPACVADVNSNCSAAEIASFDAYEWLGPAVATSIDNVLPLGEGRITRNNNGTFTITVMWDDDRQGTGTNCDPDPNVAPPQDNLRCLNLEFTP